MTSHLDFARENGWPQLLIRLGRAALRRTRDSFTSRTLRTTGFRVGANPLLLGLGHMRIGRDFHAGDNLWLDAITDYHGQVLQPRLTIGDNVSASDSVHIACAAAVSIGSGTLFGSRILISDHAHGAYRGLNQSLPTVPPAQRPLTSAGSVVIGQNVWVGDGVCILAGAVLGDGCIIGANSVVTGEIPAATIAAGAPARVIRRWDPDSGAWLSAGTGDRSRDAIPD